MIDHTACQENTYFDRTICPEPCGSMHYRCIQCGGVAGEECPVEGDYTDLDPIIGYPTKADIEMVARERPKSE